MQHILPEPLTPPPGTAPTGKPCKRKDCPNAAQQDDDYCRRCRSRLGNQARQQDLVRGVFRRGTGPRGHRSRRV